MTSRRWRVGLLSEMPPEGKVGISAVCVLGYNVNAGQEISLRLRTDDRRGMRHYLRIRETLIHELAHMVHSEHDLRFKQLNSELTREAARADWTRSAGQTLSDAPSFFEPEADEVEEAERDAGGHVLGAGAPAAGDPRAAAAAAALARGAESAMEAEAREALREPRGGSE
jgi:hypothetical protein